MTHQPEIDLRFHVPAAARVALAREMARGAGTPPDRMAPQRGQTSPSRSTRRIRTRGAVVDIAVDEVRLQTPGGAQPVCEIGFVCAAGSVLAMLALAARWQRRFGLVHQPCSLAARGDSLCHGPPWPPVRKAAPLAYAGKATAALAHGAVLDECLAQITRNAAGLCAGDPAQRTAHVHQLRVGIRRLRSALRCFAGWVPAPPVALVDALRTLFATLGQSRDSDVMDSGVVAALTRAGAPPLARPPTGAAPDVVAAITAPATQQALLGWITWRAGLMAQAEAGAAAGQGAVADGAGAAEPARAARADQKAGPGGPAAGQAAPRPLARQAVRRLQKWHARVAAAAGDFDGLDEPALHALRKRIKRLRYAVEFFTPLLRAGQVRRYLRVLAALQDRMGVLNDLFVARARYQALLASDAAAWFALGWLAARIAEARAHAKPALARLAQTLPPTA